MTSSDVGQKTFWTKPSAVVKFHALQLFKGCAMRHFVTTKMLVVLAASLSIPCIEYAHAKGLKLRFGSAIGRGLSHSGPRSYGPDVLTTDQLVICMRIEKDVNEGSEKADSVSAALTSEKQALDESFASLEKQRLTLNRQSQIAVDMFNRGVDEFQARSAAFNEKLPDYNAMITTLNAAVDKFNNSCTEKKYYESDMEAARNILAQSGK